MIRVTLEELQRDLTQLLHRVENGEKVLVCKDDVPIAEVRSVPPKRRTPRPIGLAKGEFEVTEEFFEPLPEDILRAFEGEEPED